MQRLRTPRRTTTIAAGVMLGALVAAGVSAPAVAAPPAAPFISELHYDNAGTDVGEFVEVELPAGTSSAGWSIVLYNGGNGAVYDTDPLPAVEAPADAAAVALIEYPANGIQNGSPDGLALVDPSGAVAEFLSYEGVLTAVDGPAAGGTSVDIGVSEPGDGPVGGSLARRYDQTADALVWSIEAVGTPGALNGALAEPEPEPEPVCEIATTHEIGAVQGTGDVTPLNGSTVTVRGVVVGDTPGLSGFYLQDPDGDGDPATSDGIFVFSPAEVALGDVVAVTGRAEEYFGQTQLSAGSAVDVCDQGAALPEPAPLDLPAGDEEREPLEGMLVAPVDALTVSEVYDLTSFGELTLSEGGVLVQPTELARPGEAAQAVAAENARRTTLLDDGTSARTSATSRPYLSPATPVRVGDVLEFTEPTVLGYGFDMWRLQPADGTADGVFAPQNTRPAAPEAVGGDVTVGTFNVLNYFLTWTGANARGARDEAQFERQSAKIVNAIEALDASVVGLMEIEDTDSSGYTPGDADTALAELVERLNADAGAEKWAYVPLPDELYSVARDVIRNGIIYQPAEVTTVGDPVGLVDESVWFNAREPIAQTFEAQGDVFTVISNHFKSKSPGSPTGDNVDAGDGQGEWNGDRVRQAASLAAFAQSVGASAGDEDVLLVGDFNAYSQEDPIVALEAAGYVDLGSEYDPGRYSYVFDALSGSLDHALASVPLAAKVTDVVHWNINAVESFSYQYYGDPALYTEEPYRSSDHDPLLVGLDLASAEEPPGPALCLGLVPTIVGTDGDDVLVGTNGRDVIAGLGGNDTITGLGGEDIICGGPGDDVIDGGNGSDLILGGDGDDVIRGGNAIDVLLGGRGDDRLEGGNGADLLIGGPGADTLVQGNGRGLELQGGGSDWQRIVERVLEESGACRSGASGTSCLGTPVDRDAFLEELRANVDG